MKTRRQKSIYKIHVYGLILKSYTYIYTIYKKITQKTLIYKKIRPKFSRNRPKYRKNLKNVDFSWKNFVSFRFIFQSEYNDFLLFYYRNKITKKIMF